MNLKSKIIYSLINIFILISFVCIFASCYEKGPQYDQEVPKVVEKKAKNEQKFRNHTTADMIYNMKLFEQIDIYYEDNYRGHLLRIPGGWHDGSIFIPYSEEFKQKENK